MIFAPLKCEVHAIDSSGMRALVVSGNVGRNYKSTRNDTFVDSIYVSIELPAVQSVL